jgi:hypothetical protein
MRLSQPLNWLNGQDPLTSYESTNILSFANGGTPVTDDLLKTVYFHFVASRLTPLYH